MRTGVQAHRAARGTREVGHQGIGFERCIGQHCADVCHISDLPIEQQRILAEDAQSGRDGRVPHRENTLSAGCLGIPRQVRTVSGKGNGADPMARQPPRQGECEAVELGVEQEHRVRVGDRVRGREDVLRHAGEEDDRRLARRKDVAWFVAVRRLREPVARSDAALLCPQFHRDAFDFSARQYHLFAPMVNG